MSESRRPYVVRASLTIGAWFVVALVTLVVWARWELTHEPPTPKGCVDTCFGNLPLIFGVGVTALITWGIGIGLAPRMLVHHLKAGTHERRSAVTLGLIVAATCTGIGLAVTLFACGIPIALHQ